ncbi:hypothetical protein ACN47E_005398 [Coniothyrium glycines]
MPRIFGMVAHSHAPSAAGAVTGCAQYLLTPTIPTLIEQPHENIPWQTQYSCEFVAQRFNVDVEQLLQWNPSLDSGNCVLQPDVQYCVIKIDTTKRSSDDSYDTTPAEDPPICKFDVQKGAYICPK